MCGKFSDPMPIPQKKRAFRAFGVSEKREKARRKSALSPPPLINILCGMSGMHVPSFLCAPTIIVR